MLSEPGHAEPLAGGTRPLGAIEREAIEMFINFFRLLGLPKQQIVPKLDVATRRVQRMEAAASDLPPAECEETRARIQELNHWLNRGRSMLPLALKLPG